MRPRPEESKLSSTLERPPEMNSSARYLAQRSIRSRTRVSAISSAKGGSLEITTLDPPLWRASARARVRRPTTSSRAPTTESRSPKSCNGGKAKLTATAKRARALMSSSKENPVRMQTISKSRRAEEWRERTRRTATSLGRSPGSCSATREVRVRATIQPSSDCRPSAPAPSE